MFVVSMKMSKMKAVAGVAGILLLCLVVFFAVKTGSGLRASAKPKGSETAAVTSEQRLAYLRGFGWEIEEEPLEIIEIAIPQQFDDVYQSYNDIQLKQNFDLSRYKGKRVKRYTYRVTNYPDTADEIHADLLIYDGRIIGGDICSTALDGFMHGFTKP